MRSSLKKLPTFPNGSELSILPSGARRAAILGLFSATIFSFMWALCVMFDGSWVFGTNMVSNLGVSDNIVVRDLFIVDCIVSGLGFMAHGYFVVRYAEWKIIRFTYAVCILCGFCLIIIGVFDQYSLIHVLTARFLGLTAVIAIVTSVIGDYILKNYKSMIASFAFLVIFGLSFMGTEEFMEAIGVIILICWICINCFYFLKYDEFRVRGNGSF